MTTKSRPGDGAAGGLGGVFEGLEALLKLAETLSQQGGETRREQEFTTPGGARGVFGFNVKFGIGGAQPVVEAFGNVHPTDEGLVVSETREPLVDVFDEGDEVLVVAEMPGVAEGDIHVGVSGDVLEVGAKTGRRSYEREVVLPAPVLSEPLQRTYQNGCLELRFRKTDGAGPPPKG